MSHEPTISDVLEAIGSFATSVDERFNAVDERFDAVDKKFDAVDKRFGQVDRRFNSVDEQFAVVHTEIADIRSKMVTKQELKEEITHLKEETFTEIDRFVVLHQTLDVELVAMRSRCDRMESFMNKVAKRLDLEYSPM